MYLDLGGYSVKMGMYPSATIFVGYLKEELLSIDSEFDIDDLYELIQETDLELQFSYDDCIGVGFRLFYQDDEMKELCVGDLQKPYFKLDLGIRTVKEFFKENYEEIYDMLDTPKIYSYARYS